MANKNAEAVKRFAEAKPERFKEIQAEYFQRVRLEVSDAYCRRVLRSKYPAEHIGAHPELIEETRVRIMHKREAKAAKLRQKSFSDNKRH